MSYLTGYTIKPSRITPTGAVLFSDGTYSDIRANQVTCEAYGYTYDIASGTCIAFRRNTNLERNISNINNKNNGAQNTTELGSNTVQINGTLNTAKGFNNNCFINGNANEIANGVDSATVLGSNGKALRDGEFVVGGGSAGDSSTFSLNGTTTDASATALFINGDTAVTVIARTPDTIQSYTFDIIGYRTGGSSGSGAAADRIFLRLEGIVRNNAANEALTTIAALGTVVGWSASTAYSGDDMSLKIVGAASMNISWKATARFQNFNV